MRLTAMVAALALSVGGVMGALTWRLTSGVIERTQRRHCAQLAQQIAGRAVSAYRGGVDSDALSKIAEETLQTSPVVHVSFLDSQGRRIGDAVSRDKSIASSMTEGMTPDATIGVPALVESNGGKYAYLDVTFPVSAPRQLGEDGPPSKQLFGYVRLAMSLGATRAEATSVFNLLAGTTALMLAMTLVVSFLLVRLFAAPLKSLAGVMSRFADGDLTARSTLSRGDEIGRLSNVYNMMADRLAAKQEEASRLNAELESRVRRRTRQLRELAARDSLTGLYNRRHFDEELRRRYAETARYGGQLSCVMIDVDNFKQVNDLAGHQTGDELLILVGETILKELRSADLVARVGGDEFIILLPQTDVKNALILANRVRRAFAQATCERFADHHVTLSVGVACSDDPEIADHRQLVACADRALYRAKGLGKNKVAFSSAVA